MTKDSIAILPSILAGDFGHLADAAQLAEQSGADALHVDIMDGHFVPNLTLGPRALSAIRKATGLFLDVHLMIYNPYEYIERFIEAGADRITFHFEATEDVEDTLIYIQRCNKQAGLAFCPNTSFSMMPKYIPLCDLMLIMTVNPGFGGQELLPKMLDKVCFIRDRCRQEGRPDFPIQVDGGVDDKTFRACRDAGANVFVSGSYLYEAKDMKAAIQKLRSL